MGEEKLEQVIQYRMAMSLVKELLDRSIISAEEYAIMDTIFTNMFLETSCTIFGNIAG